MPPSSPVMISSPPPGSIGTTVCDCDTHFIAPVNNTCPDNFVVLYFKSAAEDRYNNEAINVTVCVPGIGSGSDEDGTANIYRIAFCWNSACPILAPLAGKDYRMYINKAPVAAAVGGNAFGGSNVVFTNLYPQCASPTVIITLRNTGATYKVTGNQLLEHIPDDGIDNIDIDVIAPVTTGCDNAWFMAAIVPVSDAGPTTPPLPPASCPCWERTTNGSCPGIKVPILLETIDGPEIAVTQCIDPANFDVYTGRMAYSYCWRYACLPPQFASTRFRATVTDLERWNIAKMSGTYQLSMLRADGVHMNVTGKPKNPALPIWEVTEADDGQLVTLPEGGVGNFTFEYIIPPAYDDLSAAVVMDSNSTGRSPPPPSPPSITSTTCACPLAPLDTIGGTDTQCNSTYATALVRLSNDPNRVVARQCVAYPNYDVFLREMAFSYCWRYSCLPAECYGKSYNVTIEQVSKYNIQLMPSGKYDLLGLFPPPMEIDVTINHQTLGSTTYNIDGNWGTPIMGGRLQEIVVAPGDATANIANLTINYYIPSLVQDGLAAAVVMRYHDGTAPPSPPSPPSPPPAPPSPPQLGTGQPRVYVTTDYLVTASIPVQVATANGLVNTGSYVTVPIQFYDYLTLATCSEPDQEAFRQQLARVLGVDASTITVSCRLAVPTPGQSPLRRLLGRFFPARPAAAGGEVRHGVDVQGAIPRLLQGTSAGGGQLVDAFVTYVSTGSNVAAASTTLCAAVGSVASGAGSAAPNCDTTAAKANARYTLATYKEQGTTAATVCPALQAMGTQALLASGAGKADIVSMGCTATPVSADGQEKPATPVGLAPTASATPYGANTPVGSDNSGGGGGSNSLSTGAIIGIVVGTVCGVIIAAVAGLAVRARAQQARANSAPRFGDVAGGSYDSPPPVVAATAAAAVPVAPEAAAPATMASRLRSKLQWKTYSMEQKEQEALRGNRPIAGVSNYA